MTAFSDTVNNTGIVQQVRALMRVDANQWPTAHIVNSVNNWHDTVTGYAIAADRRFQWDDTNHTHLPVGTTNVVASQTDYSFLTDEQGNRILNLIGLSLKDASGKYQPLDVVDYQDPTYNPSKFGIESGIPTKYDKLADNIIRLDKVPAANITAGLKFYFQRVGSYFDASDTTKQPGVANLLHRGYIVAGAYDGALALGLNNLQPLSVERQMEEMKMIKYFAGRNHDEKRRMTPSVENTR